ncbi:MAG: insulinase family protein [Capnocytophaga sp.]|nr:insulinase family protein [Capnocytophaga sp.]
MHRKLYHFIFINILCLLANVQAQDTSFISASLPDETIHQTLPNGFQYYIKKNNSPSDRIEIRFCLKVGAFHEQENQAGIAHFLEHLAFDGSKKFPNSQALEYWENLGAKFGYHINAYTTDDRTIYSLSIPADRQGKNLKHSLRIIADWLRNLSISEKDIQKQKRIISQEIAGYQSPEDINHIKRGIHPKATELPIATEKEILALDQKALKQFYDQWYQPQNAGIIVVGQINMKETQQTIKKLFGKIPPNGSKTVSHIPLLYDENYRFQSEKTTNENAKMSIFFPQEAETINSFSKIVNDKKRDFAVRLVRNRLQKLKCYIGVSSYWYLQKTRFLEIYFEDFSKLNKAIAIIEGIKQKGISEQEIQSLLPEYIAKLRPLQEKSNTQWSDNFTEMFIFDEQQLFTEKDYNQLSDELLKTTPEQWQEIIKKYFSFTEIMLINYQYNPEKHTEISYQNIENIFKESKASPDFSVPLPEDISEISVEHVQTSLNEKLPFSKQMIQKEVHFPAIDTYEITLSNGVKLYLKPTEGEKNIQVSLISKGGLSLLPPPEIKKMEDIISHISMGGTQNLPENDFSNLLYQENISFMMNNENFWHGATGTAPAEKSALFANIIVEKILHPELSELSYEEFEIIKQDELKTDKTLRKQDENAVTTMEFRKEELIGNIIKNYRSPKTLQEIEALNLDSLHYFYQKNYINPHQMAVFITGNFEKDSIKKHFASSFHRIFPSYSQQVFYNYLQDIPFENKEEIIKSDKSNRLIFSGIYYGKFENSLRNQLILKLMKEILDNRLLQELREKRGIIYSPYSELSFRVLPSPAFFFIINGETDSKYAPEIKNSIAEIIHTLQKKTISKAELNSYKKMFLTNKKETLTADNARKWLEYLENSYKNLLTLEELNNYENILLSIQIEDIKNAFSKLLEEKNHIYLKVF